MIRIYKTNMKQHILTHKIKSFWKIKYIIPKVLTQDKMSSIYGKAQ